MSQTKIDISNLSDSVVAALSVPKISLIDYPGDDTAADPAGGQIITLNGSGFVTGSQVFIDGYIVSVVTVNSSGQITFVSPAKASGSYEVRVVNPDGGIAASANNIQYSGVPVWSTSSGSIANVYEGATLNSTISASSDSAITYSLISGVLPGNVALTGNLISGSVGSVVGNTTYNFTIDAIDAELQNTSRNFNIGVLVDSVSWSTPANNATITAGINSAVTQTLSASADSGSNITYSANTLPAGLSLVAGQITGNATALANTTTLLTATSTQSGKAATRIINFQITSDSPVWSSPAAGRLANVYEGSSVSSNLLATSDSLVSYSVSSGSLPTGVSLVGNVISGTTGSVNSNTTYSFDIAATDAELQSSTRSFSIDVLLDTVSWSTPNDNSTITANVDTQVTQVLSASASSGATITYSANALPSGLSLVNDTITGTANVVANTTTLLTATSSLSGKTATRTINFQINSAAIAPGQVEYITSGTYDFTVPAGVTSISAVLVGAGGVGFVAQSGSGAVGGGGGGLRYINDLPVTPGETLQVVVGQTGIQTSTTVNTDSTPSILRRSSNVLVQADAGSRGGVIPTSTPGSVGGGGGTGLGAGPYGGTIGGGNGGSSGLGRGGSSDGNGGGGGAGGYSGNGGTGISQTSSVVQATAGQGGAGGGGGAQGSGVTYGGGGVGIYGEGASGAAGLGPSTGRTGGGGGSGGESGGTSGSSNTGIAQPGGNYGGGGGATMGTSWSTGRSHPGGTGAVRIIWGTGRAFPATNTQNM